MVVLFYVATLSKNLDACFIFAEGCITLIWKLRLNETYFLLTIYMTKLFHTLQMVQFQLLKTLTSNWRTPALVWDNSTRAELQDLLRNTKTEDPEGPLIPPFTYTAHEGLLAIGGIYVGIYNEQPEFPIQVSDLTGSFKFKSRRSSYNFACVPSV